MDYAQKAREKFKRRDVNPYGVTAVFVREDREHPDRDGAQWDFLATDDGYRVAPVKACLSGTNGGELNMQIDVAVLEAVVEERSGDFPIETRLKDIRHHSPLVIRRALGERLLAGTSAIEAGA